MALITTGASLSPGQLHKYLDSLGELGLPCHFLARLTTTGTLLDLYVDGSSHNGTVIRLDPDGTYEVTTHVVIGEKP